MLLACLCQRGSERLLNEFQAAIVRSSTLDADHRDVDELSWVNSPPATPPAVLLAALGEEREGQIAWPINSRRPGLTEDELLFR